jgi:hypothetical protein
MKSLLIEFVDWAETAHFQGGGCGSVFEQPVSPHALAWADRALELALSSGRPVVLFTRTAPAQSVVAGLVFHRAGVNIENVYNGDLDDDAFDRLTTWLSRIKTARLVFEQGFPPAPGSLTGHVAEGKYVIVC